MASPDPNNQYPYRGLGAQAPTYQQYSTVPPQYHQPQSYSSNYPPGHHYAATSPAHFVAELPAALPPAPPTVTSAQQLTEDELLARKLQNLEVEEARRRSSSNLSLRTSQYSLRDAASPATGSSQTHLRPNPSTVQARPHSESVSSLSSYRLGSSAVSSTSLDPSDGSCLPEVVVGARPASTTGVELRPTLSTTQPATPLPAAPSDPISLSSYLELHREVPPPPQWALPPVTETLYASSTRVPTSTNWLDIPLSREWRTVRSAQNALTPVAPSYTFNFKFTGGNYRDSKYTWTMLPEKWTYNLRIDKNTNMRRSEILTPPKGNDLITTYIRAANYDSLRFVGHDGCLYKWVAHAPLSSANGARYDTLRHALFMAPNGTDPLYGNIVADHTYWDGFINYAEVHAGISCLGCGASPINGLRWECGTCADHDICEQCRLSNNSIKPTCTFTLANLPDEALNIRSPKVDTALVVATLQIMRDWEFHTLRMQKRSDPRGFKISEDLARKGNLGRLSYWNSNDNSDKLPMAGEKEKDLHDTVDKISDLVKSSAQIGGAVADAGSRFIGGSRSWGRHAGA